MPQKSMNAPTQNINKLIQIEICETIWTPIASIMTGKAMKIASHAERALAPSACTFKAVYKISRPGMNMQNEMASA